MLSPKERCLHNQLSFLYRRSDVYLFCMKHDLKTLEALHDAYRSGYLQIEEWKYDILSLRVK